MGYHAALANLLQDRRAAIVNVALASFLMFITGSSFSLSVFTNAVEHAARPAGVFDGVWPSAMGIMYFVSAPVMIFTGVFLDGGIRQKTCACSIPFLQSKTGRVRILALLSAAAFAVFGLAGLGVRRGLPALVRNAVFIQGVPLGIGYLLNLELLVSWIPERPGLAVGCAQLAFGFGSIVLASVFHSLLTIFGPVSAIYISAAILCTCTIVPACFVRWPAKCEAAGRPAAADSSTPLIAGGLRSMRIPWYRLCTLRPFWLYIAVIFTGGAGYAFIPFFFKLGAVFHQEMDALVGMYQVISLLATILGVGSSVMTDSLRFGNGYWFSGARNVSMVLLSLQSCLFLCLIPLSNAENFTGFVLVVAVLIMMLASHAGCTALLSRDVFGSANGCIVFGIGAGLAMGSGEGYSTGIMAMVEAGWKGEGTRTAAGYNLFYAVAAVWSLAGLACVASLERCEEAFVDAEGEEEREGAAVV